LVILDSGNLGKGELSAFLSNFDQLIFRGIKKLKLQDATSTLTEFITKYGPGRSAAATAILTELLSTSTLPADSPKSL
jgi:hypothetical protein